MVYITAKSTDNMLKNGMLKRLKKHAISMLNMSTPFLLAISMLVLSVLLNKLPNYSGSKLKIA